MWWLSFRDGSAVVIEATSLLHARLLAAVNLIDRAAQFVSGYELSPERAALIPQHCTGRLLSRDDAWRLNIKLCEQLERERAARSFSAKADHRTEERCDSSRPSVGEPLRFPARIRSDRHPSASKH